MKKSLNGFYRNNREGRWSLLSTLTDRLEKIQGVVHRRDLIRLARGVGSVEELIQRYSNDSML